MEQMHFHATSTGRRACRGGGTARWWRPSASAGPSNRSFEKRGMLIAQVTAYRFRICSLFVFVLALNMLHGMEDRRAGHNRAGSSGGRAYVRRADSDEPRKSDPEHVTCATYVTPPHVTNCLVV